jgi:hypothetical protein
MTIHTDQVGMNRTGIQMSPIDSKAMQDVDPSMISDEPGDESALADLRNDYIANADTLGSVPLPGTVNGALTMGFSILKGGSPQILIDKLGERLAFERMGTRLYDALITKCEIMLDGDISMTIDDLEQIRADEARHFLLLRDQIAPPTINLDRRDEDNHLDLVPHVARPLQITHAMTNSFGFGGTNASLVFSKP